MRRVLLVLAAPVLVPVAVATLATVLVVALILAGALFQMVVRP